MTILHENTNGKNLKRRAKSFALICTVPTVFKCVLYTFFFFFRLFDNDFDTCYYFLFGRSHARNSSELSVRSNNVRDAFGGGGGDGGGNRCG